MQRQQRSARKLDLFRLKTKSFEVNLGPSFGAMVAMVCLAKFIKTIGLATVVEIARKLFLK
jgi:hypothetical protein